MLPFHMLLVCSYHGIENLSLSNPSLFCKAEVPTGIEADLIDVDFADDKKRGGGGGGGGGGGFVMPLPTVGAMQMPTPTIPFAYPAPAGPVCMYACNVCMYVLVRTY